MVFGCTVCGKSAIFSNPETEKCVPACPTCRDRHYVCYVCLERLGFGGVPYPERPCFDTDEFRVAAALTGRTS